MVKLNKQSGKAIIWGRVSTTQQEVETQVAELKAMAIADGYEEENLITIKSEGASAIKQNELYKREVNNLITTLDNDSSIKCVYVWEVSRIARVELTFFQMKDYFVKNKIQFIVRTPAIHLLDRDGNVDRAQEVIMNLLVTLAKQEMEITQARMNRGKARNKAEGKYNGGRLKLGYRLTPDKYFEINPERAELVRMIFTKYANNQASVCALHKELVNLGIYNVPSAGYNGVKQMNAILKDKAYIGENGYPRLVSDEVFYAVQEKLASHPKRHKPKNIYFCSSIMKDKDSGFTFIADAKACIYTINHLKPALQLSINYVDFACWFVAMNLKNMNLSDEIAQNKDLYETKITENTTKISNLQKQLEESQKQIDRAINMNIMQPVHFSTEKMNAVIGDCEKKINQIKVEIANLETDNSHLQQMIEQSNKMSSINLTDELTDSMKREIIDSVIEKILVTRIEQRYYKIQFINKIGYIDNSYWLYDTRKCGARGAKLYMVDANGAKLDVSDYVRKNKRFIRKYK